MKNINKYIIGVSAAIAALASCSKEASIVETVVPEAKMVEVTLQASQAVTKTSMATNGDILWSEGDQIAVTYSTGTYTFTLESGAGSTTAAFKGSILEESGDPVAATYPVAEVALGNAQQYLDGTFADNTLPMTATYSEGGLVFTATAAVVLTPSVPADYEGSVKLSYEVAGVKYEPTMALQAGESAKNLIFVVVPGAQNFVVTYGETSVNCSASEATEAGSRYKLTAAPSTNGPVIDVTAATAQDVLDGKYGCIDGKTINFTEDITDVLVIGRPTKYEGSNTEYRHGSFTGEALSLEDFLAYKNQTGWTEYSYYSREIQNITFTSNEGVTLAGFTFAGATGHIYQPGHDYVRDKDFTNGTNDGYYGSLVAKNITFDGLNIASSQSYALDFNITSVGKQNVIDGITVKDCNITNSGAGTIHCMNNGGSADVYKNITVDGSVLNYTGSATNSYGIMCLGTGNLTVNNSELRGMTRAVQTQNASSGSTIQNEYGTFAVTDSKFYGVKDYVIKVAATADMTGVTITGNYSEGCSASCMVRLEPNPYAGTGEVVIKDNSWQEGMGFKYPWNKGEAETVAVDFTADPIEIRTAAEFMQIFEGLSSVPDPGYPNKTGKTVLIMNDIDFAGVAYGSTSLSLKSRVGVTIDGQGYALKNIEATSATADVALFGTTSVDANGGGYLKFKDLTVKDSKFSTTATDLAAAAFVGHTANFSMEGCTVDNCQISSTKFAGGFIGYDADGSGERPVFQSCTVKNTAVTAQNTSGASTSAGGFVGYTQTPHYLNNCAVTGNTVTAKYAGAYYGNLNCDGHFNNCTVNGTVATTQDEVDGRPAYGNAIFPVAETKISSQEEFVTACANAVSGDTIVLDAGEFAITSSTIGEKALYIKGQGAITVIRIGNADGDGNGGTGTCNKSPKLSFENLSLTTLSGKESANYTGFTEEGELYFKNVTFQAGFSNWGNQSKDVTFVNCTFNQTIDGRYNVQELRSGNNTHFLFDGCTFNSTPGRFINAYEQGGAAASIEIVVKDCAFSGTTQSKAALNLKTGYADGCNITLYLLGNNTTDNVKNGSKTGNPLFDDNDTHGIVKQGATKESAVVIWENGAAK